MKFPAGWALGFSVGLGHLAQSKDIYCRVSKKGDLYGSGDQGGGGAENTAEKRIPQRMK